MSEYAPLTDATKNKADRENFLDYAGALRTISAARGLFLLLLILSLLLHLGVYCAGRWTRVFEPTQTAQADLVTPAASPAEGGAEPADGAAAKKKPVETDEVEHAMIYHVIELVLPLSQFIGQVSCGALLLCYLLAVNVALSGRLGGVRGSVAAFFWMVVLLALLFPWERWLGGVRGDVQVPGVYATFADLTHLPGDFAGLSSQIIHYARYLGYPVLVLLIAVAGDRRYARAYRLAQRQIEARVNARTI